MFLHQAIKLCIYCGFSPNKAMPSSGQIYVFDKLHILYDTHNQWQCYRTRLTDCKKFLKNNQIESQYPFSATIA